MSARECSKWNQACIDAVWPTISDALGGGEIEVRHGDIFDYLCDIDAVQRVGASTRALSLRVQYDNPRWGKGYETSTIRYKNAHGTATEHDKLMAGMDDNNVILPAVSIHAYTSKPRGRGYLKRVAVMWTRDLGAYIKRWGYDLICNVHAESGKCFGVVKWSNMIHDITERHVLIWFGEDETSPPRLKPYCKKWVDEFALGVIAKSGATVKT